jgi:2,4-dienoyl-CoA reductase-like NADH-dependent reductase (Old Yellow Enzyme family)
MPTLFDPIRYGAIEAPNRIVMAPLTRGRSTREHVPTPLMADYYAQRAGAGLIITEATGISQQGLGWPYAPGLWTHAQTEAWKPIVAAVHAKGGRIVAQLWHMGRIVHSSFLGDSRPVSASATAAPGHAHTYDGSAPHVQARPLELAEIPRLLDDYRHAAVNALEAGFDGVQVHAANGYLIDQFLRDNSNFRADAYGGPIENRIRLLREVTAAVIEVAGADRTGVRLSPNGESQGVNDSHPHALFGAAAAMLSTLGIAFLEMREPPADGTRGKPTAMPVHPVMRAAFHGPMILNSDFDGPRAGAAIAAREADAIAFGRLFIANPDLTQRLALGAPLNAPDAATFYTRGAKGYTDYPALVA